MTKDKIKEILDSLNTLQEQLLSMPDDMLLNIDPRDNESLEHGYQFITTFNNILEDFTGSSHKIADLIKQHFKVNPEVEDVETDKADRQSRERIIRELDTATPHTLVEDFTYKRPYGFILGDAAYKGLKTWRNLYVYVLRVLKNENQEKFYRLTSEEKFISNRGNPQFSTNEDDLWVGEKIEHGFYAEVNRSANYLRNNIKTLLEHFEIPPENMKIYLREDRDAG